MHYWLLKHHVSMTYPVQGASTYRHLLALYNLDIGWGFELLFALSSQIVGISLAGIFRRFLVW